VPSIDLSSTGINLHSGDIMDAQLVYDGTNLTMTLTDTVTKATVTEAFPVNIPSNVGGNVAFVGFTGGTGGEAATQNVLSWTYVSPAGQVAATPTFSLAAGTYTAAQSVTIGDATAGTTIYYTTNGTAPTTSSSVYNGPITVSATETVQAIAVETGYTNSPVASATYTINPLLPAPTFSPTPGTYTAAQSVTIGEATAGTTIYYTTNGATPTTSSTKYGGPITVSATETLQAIAVETGYTNSAVASATYTINPATIYVSYPSDGFTTSSLSLNNGPTVTGGVLELTDGGTGEIRSAWYEKAVPVNGFTADFTFQMLNAAADGMTFTIQNDPKAIWALGDGGGGLGYQGIQNSVALKFDIYNNAGEGTDSIGVYTDGAAPNIPATDLSSSGIKLSSGDPIYAQLVYAGTTLTVTLTDTKTGASVANQFTVNISAVVGGTSAYVGFTGSSGSMGAVQEITSWTYSVP
jgi:LysM repeat protein